MTKAEEVFNEIYSGNFKESPSTVKTEALANLIANMYEAPFNSKGVTKIVGEFT